MRKFAKIKDEFLQYGQRSEDIKEKTAYPLECNCIRYVKK